MLVAEEGPGEELGTWRRAAAVAELSPRGREGGRQREHAAKPTAAKGG